MNSSKNLNFDYKDFENFWLRQELIATGDELSLYYQELLLLKAENNRTTFDAAVAQTKNFPHAVKEYERKIADLKKIIERNYHEKQRVISLQEHLDQIAAIEKELSENYEICIRAGRSRILTEKELVKLSTESSYPRLQFLLRKRAFLTSQTAAKTKEHIQNQINEIDRDCDILNEEDVKRVEKKALYNFDHELQDLLKKRKLLQAQLVNPSIQVIEKPEVKNAIAPENPNSISYKLRVYLHPVLDIAKKIVDNIDDIWGALRNLPWLQKAISETTNVLTGQILTSIFSGGINVGELNDSAKSFNKVKNNPNAKQRKTKLATHAVSIGFLAAGVVSAIVLLGIALYSLKFTLSLTLIDITVALSTFISLPPLIKYILQGGRFQYSLSQAEKEAEAARKDLNKKLNTTNGNEFKIAIKKLHDIQSLLTKTQEQKKQIEKELFAAKKTRKQLPFKIAQVGQQIALNSQNSDKLNTHLLDLKTELVKLDAILKDHPDLYHKICKEEFDLQQQYHAHQVAIENNPKFKPILDAQHYSDRAEQRVSNLRRERGFKGPESTCNMITFAGGVIGALAFAGVITWGIAPTVIAALIGTGMALGTAVQIFKAVDANNNYKYTNAIRDFSENFWTKTKNFFGFKTKLPVPPVPDLLPLVPAVTLPQLPSLPAAPKSAAILPVAQALPAVPNIKRSRYCSTLLSCFGIFQNKRQPELRANAPEPAPLPSLKVK